MPQFEDFSQRTRLVLNLIFASLTLCAIAFAIFLEDYAGALVGLLWLGIYGSGAWTSIRTSIRTARSARTAAS